MQRIMQRSAFFTALGLAFTAILSSAPAQAQNIRAQAQNIRSFVSAQTGDDGNNCSRPSPCRTFASAYTKTAVSGEINTLDPGGYGPLTIDHSISIVSGLGEAGVLVPSGGTGITISAGVNDIINLRGLIIEGAGLGASGIVFNTGKSLTIEKCVVRRVTNIGIVFFPNATSSLAISDTLVANTGSNAINVMQFGSGDVTAVFSRVEAVNAGGTGILVDGSSGGTVNVTVTDSVVARNGSIGIAANSNSPGGGATNVMVVRSVVANNGTGIKAIGNLAGPTSVLRIGQSTVTGNASGWQAQNGGVVQSYGTNQVNGNDTNQTQIPAVTGGSN
jgi:hypothetical protein